MNSGYLSFVALFPLMSDEGTIYRSWLAQSGYSGRRSAPRLSVNAKRVAFSQAHPELLKPGRPRSQLHLA